MVLRRLVLTLVIGNAWAALPVYAQSETAPAAPLRYVAIGCISRAAGTSASSTATRRYVLTDRRGDPPTAYRLDGGDAVTLEFHVGHTVEIAGTLTMRAGTGTLTLKVGSLAYVSNSCKNPSAK